MPVLLDGESAADAAEDTTVFDVRRCLGVGVTVCFGLAGALLFGDLAAGEGADGCAGVDGGLVSGVDVDGAVAGPGVCADAGAGDGVDAAA